jgi:hypothetical protein
LVNKAKRSKKPTKENLSSAMGVVDFEKWLKDEADRTGKSQQKIIEETFRDGFLTWSVNDTESIAGKQKVQEVGGGEVAQAPPILTAWAMPNVAEDIDELRRLRREFAPVSRSVDYIKGMILGNDLDVEIEEPEDKSKQEIRDGIKKFMKMLYQDEYTRTLYTLVSIMLDESLTVGCAGAEIRYENSNFNFLDYVESEETASLPNTTTQAGVSSNRGGVFYKMKEPIWKDLKSIVQLKLYKNANGRLKLYRNPATWEANFWTLDEIVSTGDTAMALPQPVMKTAGSATRFHTWQIFWLNVNRRDFDERGISVIAPVKNIALLLEKILSAIGEGIYRAGNKKYFIVCGTEKRPWSKPHIRNVMQQIQEMGKRNWTTVPVPYGFDIKEIGGNVFQANQIITILINLLAEGMHVPIEIIGVQTRAVNPATGERQLSQSFNEIEQMRYEFKSAIENQLFMKQLWCTFGKTRTKQGGKAEESIYLPLLKCSTKGLMSPFDKLEQIIKLLNVANPVSPQMKLELEREMATVMGYDNIDFETQKELKDELKKRVGTDTSIANPILGKTQGQPEPQTKGRQQARQAGGVNKSLQGGGRIPKEQKSGIMETLIQEIIDYDVTSRRRELQSLYLNPEAVNDILEKEKLQRETILSGLLEIQETPLTQENPQHPQRISPTAEYERQSSQKTGGNFGPQGYYTVMEIPEVTKEGDSFDIDGPIVDQKITIEIRKLKDAVARYNKDLTKIYIDPSAKVEDYKAYIAHEVFEFQLDQNLGMDYTKAEEMATKWEKIACIELEMDWDEHEKRFKEAMAIISGRKGIKNPDDVVTHIDGERKPKAIKPKQNQGDVSELASDTGSSMRRETGDKEAKVGGPPNERQDLQYAHETEPQKVQLDINIKTEPSRNEVVVETRSPEIEKAISELAKKQDDTQKKLDSVSKELNDKQDVLNKLQEEQRKETKTISEERITAEMTKINMEIVNLEAERRKTEAEIKSIQDSAQKKKELMEKMEKKLKGEK